MQVDYRKGQTGIQGLVGLKIALCLSAHSTVTMLFKFLGND